MNKTRLSGQVRKQTEKSKPKVLVRRPWVAKPGEWECALRIDQQTFSVNSDGTKKGAQWTAKLRKKR